MSVGVQGRGEASACIGSVGGTVHNYTQELQGERYLYNDYVLFVHTLALLLHALTAGGPSGPKQVPPAHVGGEGCTCGPGHRADRRE